MARNFSQSTFSLELIGVILYGGLWDVPRIQEVVSSQGVEKARSRGMAKKSLNLLIGKQLPGRSVQEDFLQNLQNHGLLATTTRGIPWRSGRIFTSAQPRNNGSTLAAMVPLISIMSQPPVFKAASA